MTDITDQALSASQGLSPGATEQVTSVRGRRSLDAVTLRGAQAFLRQIRSRYPVREALLFGSRARGTHRADSDADLAVVLAGDSGVRSRISGEMAEIAFDVLMETGILVQAVPLWESEWRQPDRFSNPALIASIRRDGLRL